MAFSGSKNWSESITRDDIIKSAFRKIGVYDSADGVPAAELSDAALSLNALVKEWNQQGQLWLRNRCVEMTQRTEEMSEELFRMREELNQVADYLATLLDEDSEDEADEE